MSYRKYEINEFLSLKLLNDKTVIFINNVKFRQCKYILLDIDAKDVEKYSSIRSIDDMIDNLDHSLEENPGMLRPETEFWAHCSNLQAWVENDYNTDLLVITLSFPLLKKLTDAGDSNAERVFKEEVRRRLTRGDLSTVGYLIAGDYLKIFTDKEINSVFSLDNCVLFDNIFKIYKKDELNQFSLASYIYRKMSKFLFSLIEAKLQLILETKNIDELCIFFNYHMLDFLTDNQISALFNSPINLLEKTINILNNISYEDIGIEEGLLSKKVESVLLMKNIREKLLKIIDKNDVSFDVLFYLDLLKFLKNDCTDYLNLNV